MILTIQMKNNGGHTIGIVVNFIVITHSEKYNFEEEDDYETKSMKKWEFLRMNLKMFHQ